MRDFQGPCGRCAASNHSGCPRARAEGPQRGPCRVPGQRSGGPAFRSGSPGTTGASGQTGIGPFGAQRDVFEPDGATIGARSTFSVRPSPRLPANPFPLAPPGERKGAATAVVHTAGCLPRFASNVRVQTPPEQSTLASRSKSDGHSSHGPDQFHGSEPSPPCIGFAPGHLTGAGYDHRHPGGLRDLSHCPEPDACRQIDQRSLLNQQAWKWRCRGRRKIREHVRLRRGLQGWAGMSWAGCQSMCRSDK